MPLGSGARTTGRSGVAARIFKFGSGPVIYGITNHVVSVNPANIATAATQLATAVTVAGVKASDIVVATPPAALEEGLLPVSAIASGTDTVTLTLFNATAGALNGAALNWTFTVIHLS